MKLVAYTYLVLPCLYNRRKYTSTETEVQNNELYLDSIGIYSHSCVYVCSTKVLVSAEQSVDADLMIVRSF